MSWAKQNILKQMIGYCIFNKMECCYNIEKITERWNEIK